MTTNKEKLGELGEKLIEEYLKATRSKNRYDMEKDMIVNATQIKVEVKTQRRDIYRSMFTVNTMHKNQVEKCVSVDKLIFVEYDETDDIKIWECTDRKYQIYRTSDDRIMAGWPINKMQLLDTITDKELASKMRSFSQSRHFNLNSPYAINKF
jgi:hypothetical protein